MGDARCESVFYLFIFIPSCLSFGVCVCVSTAWEQRCALKFCPVSEMEDLKNEIGMQCLSKHPNIVNLREAFVTKTEVRRAGGGEGGGEGSVVVQSIVSENCRGVMSVALSPCVFREFCLFCRRTGYGGFMVKWCDTVRCRCVVRDGNIYIYI